MVSALLAMTVNVGVLLILSDAASDRLSVGLIALLSGGATLLNMTINAVRAHRRGMMRLRKGDWAELTKIVLCALAMAPAIWFAAGTVSSDFMKIILGAAAGIAVYVLLTLLVRCETITGIFGKIRSKI